MTLKKTCNGCRAYEYAAVGNYSGLKSTCSLRYAQIKGVPAEPCPKPRTVAALISAPKSP